MKEQKDKKSSAKARPAPEPTRVTTHKTESTKMVDTSKPRGPVWTSTKVNPSAQENDLLTGNCFVCHKPGHTSKECPDRPRINALDDEFDRSSGSDSEPKN